MARFKFLLVLFILIYSCPELSGQSKDSVNVMRATEKFLFAFNNFNWSQFRQSFDSSATIFYPEWKPAGRIAGKVEIEKTWLELFPEFADSANTAKMNVTPRDVFIQLYGETAIVSFHLGDGKAWLSRRTLVMLKRKDDWKIVHLHASFMTAKGN